MPECLQPSHTSIMAAGEELYMVEGVTFGVGSMLIPNPFGGESWRSYTWGNTVMKVAARQWLWWPGKDKDIHQVWDQCRTCNGMSLSNHRESLEERRKAEYPFQLIVTDFFYLHGHNYLVMADKFTGWPVLFKLVTSTVKMIKTLQNIFAQYGVLEDMATDSSLPFNAHEFRQFLGCPAPTSHSPTGGWSWL